MALVDLHLLDGEVPVGVDPDRVVTWPARVLLLLLLALAALYGLRLFLLPLPVGAIAPPAGFSASRAARQVETIAAAPAGIESALASSLASLGLEVERLPAQSRSVAARLRGTQPDGTILLVTPYDPAGSAPGLSGAAAMIEAFRALGTGPKPKNDILVLFSASRPLDETVLAAYGAALVLRFERISDRGPVALLATTAGSGPLVREALRGLPHPTVTLVANDLGLRPVSRTATLSFAAIGGPSTVSAGPDLRTIQDAGETALDLLRRFGSRPLPVPSGPDVVAFTVGQDQVVTYPARWSRSLGLVSASAAVVLLAIGFLQEEARSPPLRDGPSCSIRSSPSWRGQRLSSPSPFSSGGIPAAVFSRGERCTRSGSRAPFSPCRSRSRPSSSPCGAGGERNRRPIRSLPRPALSGGPPSASWRGSVIPISRRSSPWRPFSSSRPSSFSSSRRTFHGIRGSGGRPSPSPPSRPSSFSRPPAVSSTSSPDGWPRRRVSPSPPSPRGSPPSSSRSFSRTSRSRGDDGSSRRSFSSWRPGSSWRASASSP